MRVEGPTPSFPTAAEQTGEEPGDGGKSWKTILLLFYERSPKAP